MVGICGLLNCNSEESKDSRYILRISLVYYIDISLYKRRTARSHRSPLNLCIFCETVAKLVLHFGNARWKCIKHRSALGLVGWAWPRVFLRAWAARMADVGSILDHPEVPPEMSNKTSFRDLEASVGSDALADTIRERLEADGIEAWNEGHKPHRSGRSVALLFVNSWLMRSCSKHVFFTCPPIEERWLQQMISGICRLFALFMLQGSVNLWIPHTWKGACWTKMTGSK